MIYIWITFGLLYHYSVVVDEFEKNMSENTIHEYKKHKKNSAIFTLYDRSIWLDNGKICYNISHVRILE